MHCDKCSREIQIAESLYLVDEGSKAVCLACYSVLCPPCPSCGVALPKRPKKRFKCPACEQTINIRTTQTLFETDLLTDAQAAEVDGLSRSELWRFGRGKITHLFTKLVGVSHRNRDGSSRQRTISECQSFERLVLDHEEDNTHDSNAVRVLRSNGSQIGYLKAELAQAIVALVKRGHRFAVFLVQVTGGSNRVQGANLLIIGAPARFTDLDVQTYVNSIRPEIQNSFVHNDEENWEDDLA